MSKNIRIAPDYYDRFRCKGGACRNSCCMGWGISVSSSEYFRLIGQDCSSELHHRLECAFRPADDPSPERYALISHNWLGDCPMHDADGLCMLHKECGENALPSICRLYPRRMENSSGLLKCSCTNGCEGVTELLALKEDPISFHREELAARSVLSTENPNPELSRACIDIMQNRALSLPERLTRIRRLLESFAQSGRIDQSAAEAPLAEAPCDTSCALPLMIHILEQLSETSPSLQRFGADASRFSKDGVHPLPEGAQYIGEIFRERVIPWIAKNEEARA